MILDEKLLSFLETQKSANGFDDSRFLEQLSKDPARQTVFHALFSIGELSAIFSHPSFSFKALNALLDRLVSVESFYKEMGGIAGYHEKVCSLLQSIPVKESSHTIFHAPSFIDISNPNEETKQAIQWGIDALFEMAEIFPLGGAADRLHLVDEKTGQELPAAKLKFLGKTLLERLICDVQARERLYYLKYDRKIITPIAIMTSLEKENHFHIEKMMEENQWFGRPKDQFRIFTQPLVPVVNERGRWIFSKDLSPLMKPGGHGAIWKMAHDEKIFEWFKSLGKKKALVRQINNPIAGLDYGLLAFIGIGWRNRCKFGFASCPRVLRAAEGVNVLIEKKEETKSSLVLTNIEYCDFEKFGISDLPLKEGEPYSRFSSNTNILFVDLDSIQQAVQKCPFPGLLLNLKNGSFINSLGVKEEAKLARLESTMQNIADVFVEEKQKDLTTKETFITYNFRHKTIATTKRAFIPGGNFQETPESCFYDFLYAARELLETFLNVRLPPQRSFLEYLEKGPEFVFLYHPAIGPLYEIIAKKIQRGKFALGSELILELSDVEIFDLNLDGSLRIFAERVMGEKDDKNQLEFSSNIGRATFRNVTIQNKGIDFLHSSHFWKGDFPLLEGVEILLKGNSEFIAENVILTGSHRFVVEDGMTLYVTEGENGLDFSHFRMVASEKL